MKTLLTALTAALMLSACGAEVATTAATNAELKKQEMESARQTKAMADKKIEDAIKALQQNAEQQRSAEQQASGDK